MWENGVGEGLSGHTVHRSKKCWGHLLNRNVTRYPAYPALKSPLSSVSAVSNASWPRQIERLAVQGRVRQVQPGEVIIEAGDKDAPFFVIKTGQVEVVQPRSTEKPVALFLRQFTGKLASRRTPHSVCGRKARSSR